VHADNGRTTCSYCVDPCPLPWHHVHTATECRPPRPARQYRAARPCREAVPRAWWSGHHGTPYLPQETSRIVHRLELSLSMCRL
jgi:hypothetical protein